MLYTPQICATSYMDVLLPASTVEWRDLDLKACVMVMDKQLQTESRRATQRRIPETINRSLWLHRGGVQEVRLSWVLGRAERASEGGCGGVICPFYPQGESTND